MKGLGTLEFIDYEGMFYSHTEYQEWFSDGFSGAYDLGRALKNGLRGNDLIPALLRDFNVWQTCPTDRYEYLSSMELLAEAINLDVSKQTRLISRLLLSSHLKSQASLFGKAFRRRF